MKVKQNNILLPVLLLLFLIVFSLPGKAQDKILVEAIKRYDAQDYAAAEKLLQPLIEKEPEHLMVNYFYGACRTENGHFGKQEIEYLQKGSMGEAPLKTDYYLATQYHALKQWGKALEHYRMFKKEALPQEVNELDIDNRINQCLAQVSNFVVANTEDLSPRPVKRTETETETERNDVIPLPDSLYLEGAGDSTFTEDSVTFVAAKEPEKASASEPIDFEVDGEMTYIDTANFRTEEGRQAFVQWQVSKRRLDSLTAKMDEWRAGYAKAKTSAQRDELGQKIISAEGELFSLQSQTRQYLRQAQVAEIDYWNSVDEQVKIEFIATLKQQTEKQAQTTEDPVLLPDTIYTEIDPEALQVIAGAEPVNQTKEDKNELIYKIQIGAYSRGLPPYIKAQFDKLSYIRKIENYTDEKGVVVYTTGNLTKLEDAVKMQNQVRQEGIQDAFVVPYINGKRITLKEAKILESEQ